jgi:hypothetical protein
MEALKNRELESITLKEFAELYVGAALKLVEEDVSLDYFDHALREILSNETSLGYGAIKYLHHSFHSSFFNERASNSPFKLSNSKNPGDLVLFL